MRTVKFTVFILSLALVCVHCGGHQEGPDAFKQMEKNKLVRIATSAVNMPFEFGSGTGVQGFDVDLGEEIGKELGYPVKWVKLGSERLFEVLKNGEVEFVLSAVSITSERRDEFQFSDPYFVTNITLARRKDKPEIKDLASLAGKRVGVETASAASLFMEKQTTAPNVTVVKFPTLDDALGALNRTEINAVAGGEHILTYSIYKSFPYLITSGVSLTEDRYGVAVRKGEDKLLGIINSTIARLQKSGEFENLRQKWFQNVMEQAEQQRQEMEREEALKSAPKMITINIIKSPDVNLNMDRLDGFQAVLTGAGGSFSSQPILTSGARGAARFPTPIPPGDYRLVFSIFQMSEQLTIPARASRTITYDMNITSRGVNLTERN